jgi:hypothetical protein
MKITQKDVAVSKSKKESSNHITINFMNEMQKEFAKSINEKEITIAIGPPGTAKTYIACAVALQKLLNQEFEKIYIIKSVTSLEGEAIGYLKGDMDEKMDPIMMSFKMNFNKILDEKRIEGFFQKKSIEVLPLAYLRGVNLDNCMLSGTKIQMADGSEILVEDLFKLFEQQIDTDSQFMLKSYNLDTQILEDNKLSAIGRVPLCEDDEVFEIELENGDIVKLTGNHKLYVKDKGYTMVKDLTSDDILLKISQNSDVQIMDGLTEIKIKSIKKLQPCDYVGQFRYSFNVENNHNYFLNSCVLSKNCIIIADETQNLSRFNFRTLLTRLGSNAKMLVLGDTKQSDLKDKSKSVLQDVFDMLNDDKIGKIEFKREHIVRNPLIIKIEDEFEKRWG